MTKPTSKIIKLSFQCARCFKDDADKLAWFYSSNSLWADSLLCRSCFKEAFNNSKNLFLNTSFINYKSWFIGLSYYSDNIKLGFDEIS